MYLVEFDLFQEKLKEYTTLTSIFGRIDNGAELDVEDGRVARLNEIKEKMEKDLAQVTKCIEQAKTLKFKKGDVVWHRDHGAIVIREIFVNSENWNMSERPFVFYYKGFSIKGEVTIEVNEAVPYNETSKILYDNKVD